jgi:hypothetical protein
MEEGLAGQNTGQMSGQILRPRTARRILGTLVEAGLLVSAGPGDPVRIGFSAGAVGYYFPRLYPEGVEFEGRRLAF